MKGWGIVVNRKFLPMFFKKHIDAFVLAEFTNWGKNSTYKVVPIELKRIQKKCTNKTIT